MIKINLFLFLLNYKSIGHLIAFDLYDIKLYLDNIRLGVIVFKAIIILTCKLVLLQFYAMIKAFILYNKDKTISDDCSYK